MAVSSIVTDVLIQPIFIIFILLVGSINKKQTPEAPKIKGSEVMVIIPTLLDFGFIFSKDNIKPVFISNQRLITSFPAIILYLVSKAVSIEWYQIV